MNACTVMKLRGNYARMFNEVYFFWSFFKNLKIGFLANFFNFFLKNGGVFLWTHVQSWNCGEIMRGCLMKIFFLVVFQKSQNWIFGEFFYQSLVKDEIITQEISCKTRFRFLYKIYLVEREALIFPLSR